MPVETIAKAIVAGLVAALAGGLIMIPVMNFLWGRFRAVDGAGSVADVAPPTQLFSVLPDGLERFLYVALWILGFREVVFVLPVLRLAPQALTARAATPADQALFTARYNLHLFGVLLNAAVSILFAHLVVPLFF